MQKLFFSQKITKFSASLLLAAVFTILAGCSPGTTPPTGTTGSGGTGGTTTTPNTPSLNISLLSNSLSNGTSTTVNATVLDATGAAVPNAVVTFSTDSTMATMTPINGTALTNGSGVASITLTGGSTQGASTIKATAQVGTTAVTGTTGYSVGAVTVTISAPVFGITPLSAFGNTSVTATVTGGGASSQTVNFSSICSSNGKAFLSTGISTVGGVAVASYRDNGCAQTDTITVTVSGGLATNSATLIVVPPSAGSIQYVSSLPTNISLKGTAGNEVSQVTFKVLDTGGNPLSGKTVTFGLSTTVGGIILTPNTGVAPYAIGTATSDANGLVVTNVNSGVISTAVRVTATTCTDSSAGCSTGLLLNTQSSQLTITTGIPDEYGFSLSASHHNIEGWTTDGTTAVLTIRSSDHFRNPVPVTGITFTSEGAQVGGSCTTVDGACTVIFTSQNGRPSNGRVTVLATASGEETFTDLNGNGWADLDTGIGTTPQHENEMIDPNGDPTDLPEAFVDYNENGIRDAGEPYFDFNHNGLYDLADGLFSGVLCDDVNPGRSSAGSCAALHSVDVQASQVMILSSSSPIVYFDPTEITADITLGSTAISNMVVLNPPRGALVTGQTLIGPGIPPGATISSITCASNICSATLSSAATATATGNTVTALMNPSHPTIAVPPCTSANGDAPMTFPVTVVDLNGNAMPAGTTIAFSADSVKITAPTVNYIVPDTIACRGNFAGCPASAAVPDFGDQPVTMKSDATFNAGVCTDVTPVGTLTVTVTSPNGQITTATATVTD